MTHYELLDLRGRYVRAVFARRNRLDYSLPDRHNTHYTVLRARRYSYLAAKWTILQVERGFSQDSAGLASYNVYMKFERDYTGIQRRTDAHEAERCRGYVKINGGKVYGPWGSYEEARTWRLSYLGGYHVGSAAGANYTGPHRSRGATDARTTALGRTIHAAADGRCPLDDLNALLADAADEREAPDPPELPEAEPTEDADEPLFASD